MDEMVVTLDEDNKIAIPKKILKLLDAGPGDTFSIRATTRQITLNKQGSMCLFCGELKHLHNLSGGNNICDDCISFFRNTLERLDNGETQKDG